MKIEEKITEALDSYLRDPADSSYQQGYLAALLNLDDGKHPRTHELSEQLQREVP